VDIVFVFDDSANELPQQASFPLISPQNTNKMGVEESVYLAKLAEQAERYEGNVH
jgi:hypothetical protein